MRQGCRALAGTALFLAVVVSAPSLAFAKCAQWDFNQLPAGAFWQVKQSNGWFMGLNIRQSGEELRGNATGSPDNDPTYKVGGQLQGRVDGDRIGFIVHWYNGSIGNYEGRIADDGSFGGTGFEAKSEGTKVTWQFAPGFEHRAVCVRQASAEAPAAAPPKKLDQLVVRTPNPSTGVDFTGRWDTWTSEGKKYRMDLKQDGGGRVTGSFSGSGPNGQITAGTVVGRELLAKWTQGSNAGLLSFTLDQNPCLFTGYWNSGQQLPALLNSGKWNGRCAGERLIPSSAKPAEGVDFTGIWDTEVASGAKYRVALRQDAAGNVTGEYFTITGQQGPFRGGNITKGKVDDRNLVAWWSEQGSKGGLIVFALDRNDPNRFNGRWNDGSEFPAANAAFWNGVRQGAAPAPVDPPPAAPPVAAPAAPAPGKIDLINALLALLTQAVNVRSEPRVPGAKEAPNVITTLSGGTQVRVLNCTGSWCRVEVPGVGTGFVSKKFVTLGGAAAPKGGKATPQPDPKPAPAQTAALPSFSGTWSTVTSDNVAYTTTLVQTGDSVSGNYATANGSTRGTIEGSVAGNVLRFVWSQSNGTGAGKFTLSGDGKSFTGTYSNTKDHDRRDGDWSGIKQ